MSRAVRLRLAGAVTIALGVVNAAILALRDAGATSGLAMLLVVLAWFAAPAVGVRIVRTFDPVEFSGTSAPLVIAIVVCVWVGLMLWNAVLAPLVGIDCRGLTSCPPAVAAASLVSQMAVIFAAAYGAATVVGRLQARSARPRA